MLNAPEIVVILVILAIVFGLGKLGSIGKLITTMRLKLHKELAEDYVDITSQQPSAATLSRSGPKPGTKEQTVDEAHIEAPSTNSNTDEESH